MKHFFATRTSLSKNFCVLKSLASEYIYLIRHLSVKYDCILLRVLQYFGKPAVQFRIQRTSKNMQQYYMIKCLISYLLSYCFYSEFCKHISEQKKAQETCSMTHGCVTSEVEYFDSLKKTTCQSGSFNWMNNNLFKSYDVVQLPVSPNLLKNGFVLYNISVYLYSLFGCCYALFGRY